MKSFLPLSLGLALICSAVARADDIVLGWDASSSSNKITAYKVYWGPNANPALSGSIASFTTASNVLSGIATNVGVGITHFQATAFIGTLESVPSNEVTYTNRNFAPVNLRITSSTNQTAAIWIEGIPAQGTAMVERSADLSTWTPYASVKVYDEGAANRAIFLASILPASAFNWRVHILEPYLPSAAPLPAGLHLK